ncbi:hypothetical protein B0H12DRAFT_1067804 [Mycena haematopus]|nr:hypothetical protein B0H12DRAFT_1067804 [Mycena haematopus]
MPHTPSPPSSPESVMIIGHDMQVPSHSFDKKQNPVEYTMMVAGSPGLALRPSQFLLFMALCPFLTLAAHRNGAEGTIVEGEDLSRMIWGLGMEDTGSQQHSRANSVHVSHKSTPQSNFPPRLQAQRNSQHNTGSQPHHNVSPRHQLQTSQDRLHHPSIEARNQISLRQRAFESLGPRHSSTQEHVLNVPQNSNSWTDVYRAHDDLIDQLGAYDGQHGLGFDWQETLRHQREANEGARTKPANSLKPSFSALDIHNLLPVEQRSTFAQQPVLRELQECPLDPSQELRKFVYAQMRNLDRDYTSIDFSDAGLIHQTPPLTPHPFTPHPFDSFQPRAQLPRTPSPTSPDIRVQSHNLTRQPRSVPFARMLQRRLSSVPEEESGNYTEPSSPPPSPLKAAATARPPRPPSQSPADSFQTRSHPGPSQWHTGPMSPGGSGFAPQTRTTAEHESDESRWRTPHAGKAKATVKLPLKTTNSSLTDTREEGSVKTDGSANETAWEKENGKPRRKVRSKKTKGGHSDHAVEDNVSPWLVSSQGPEAWL